MSFKSIFQNADVLNIILLMLGPHAMEAVRMWDEMKLETAAKDTEWYGYFKLFNGPGVTASIHSRFEHATEWESCDYNRLLQGVDNMLSWHIQKFGPKQYVAVWNGEKAFRMDGAYGVNGSNERIESDDTVYWRCMTSVAYPSEACASSSSVVNNELMDVCMSMDLGQLLMHRTDVHLIVPPYEYLCIIYAVKNHMIIPYRML